MSTMDPTLLFPCTAHHLTHALGLYALGLIRHSAERTKGHRSVKDRRVPVETRIDDRSVKNGPDVVDRAGPQGPVIFKPVD